MAMPIPNSTESSVAFSLAELVEMEQERVREENAARARLREQCAREAREQDERRRAEAEARCEAERVARREREREEGEARARQEAIARAAADAARFEAEAKLRAEAESAARAHELALVRARGERAGRRTVLGLAALLGLAVSAGGAGAYVAAERITDLGRETARLRAESAGMRQANQLADTLAFEVLAARHAALRTPPLVREDEPAVAVAEAARAAVQNGGHDAVATRAWAQALDALEVRARAARQLAVLDRRYDDLSAWAGAQRRGDLGPVREAAAHARTAAADEAALIAYGRALDRLRAVLMAPAPAPPRQSQGSPPAPPPLGQPGCAKPGDPLCGLNGRPI